MTWKAILGWSLAGWVVLAGVAGPLLGRVLKVADERARLREWALDAETWPGAAVSTAPTRQGTEPWADPDRERALGGGSLTGVAMPTREQWADVERGGWSRL